MRSLSTTPFLLASLLAAVAWSLSSAGLASQSAFLALNTATGLLVCAARWSQSRGQFEPSIALVVCEADHEANSRD